MKRRIGIAAAAVSGCLLIALLAPSAEAQRPYTLRSLRGIYIGGLIEIRQHPIKTGPVEYCDSSGTFTFDGAGKGTSRLIRRCSLAGTVTDTLTLTYKVAPDGGTDLLFSSGTAGRFQLALNGDLAFITAAQDPDPVVLVHQGHFVRRE